MDGGALLAALYAYGPTEFSAFDARASALLRQGLQRAIIRRYVLSPRWLRAALSMAGLAVGSTSEAAQRLAAGVGARDPAAVAAGTSAAAPRQVRHFNRTTALVDVLSAPDIFGELTLPEVAHPGLDVVLSACDLATGGAVRFGSRVSASSRLGVIQGQVRVATAVAASAAYPLLLPALEGRFRFRNNRGKDFERRRCADS